MPAPARAQGGAPPIPASTSAKSTAPAIPPTLAAALARVPWNASQGVLLTLSPNAPLPTPPPVYNTDGGLPPDGAEAGGDTTPVTTAEAAELARLIQSTPLGASTSSVRLAAVARVWKKPVSTFGGVTVLAPPTMTVLNPKPGPPNLLAHLNRAELSRYLIATFTPAQWRLLASANGIGRGDLKKEQMPLFDRLFPDPFTYTYATTHYRGRVNDPAQTHTLTSGERQALRLRVKLQTDIGAPMLAQGNEGRFFPVLFNGNRDGGIFGERKNMPPFLDLVGDNEYAGFDDVYGVKLSSQVRNKPKPGDVDYAALSGVVSLVPPVPAPSAISDSKAPSPAPVLTVGELMPRLQKATGLEIYADARLSKRLVWTRGASAARAGDVLEALCFCIGGTVRKVDAPGEKPAYVVTSDLEGIAARIGVLDDWQSEAQAQEKAIKAQMLQGVRQINPLEFLQFDASEPVKLPPALLSRVASAGKTAGSGPKGYLVVKPSELSPTEQAYLSEQVGRSSSQKGFEVGSDKYEIGASLWLGIVIPGVGEITGSPLQTVSEISPEPANAPPTPPVTGASLWARVPSTDDATQENMAQELVKAASSHKMQAVYLEGASPKTLVGAVRYAKTLAAPVAVWGVLRPLRILSSESNDKISAAAADVNARDETTAQYEAGRLSKIAALPAVDATANWRVLGSVDTLQTASREAAQLASVPGLAGLLVADALPPGYRGGTKNGVNPGDGNADYRAGAGTELGWTPAQRLAFLRQNGADPADIVPYFSYGPVQIPYFPDAGHDDGGLADAWSKWRADKGQAFLAGLRQALQTARPGLPVRVCGQLNANPLSGAPVTLWIVDWSVQAGGDVRLFWNYPKQGLPLPEQARQGLQGIQAARGTSSRGAASNTPTSVSASEGAVQTFLCVPGQNAGTAWARGGAGWSGVVFDFTPLFADASKGAQVGQVASLNAALDLLSTSSQQVSP